MQRTQKPDEAVLDELVRRIVAAVEPDRIILFGSAARETMGPHSDLDVMVVKAGRHRGETAAAARASLRGLGIPVDIVAARPEDLEMYRDSPSVIIYPALREGRTLYQSTAPEEACPMLPDARRVDDPNEWLRRARQNLRLASLGEGEVDLELRGFHLQQAAEQAIKAVFIAKGIAFPYIHDIGELLKSLEEAAVSTPVSREQAESLTKYAVLGRYLALPEAVTEEAYQRDFNTAAAIMLWAEQQLAGS